MAGLFSDPSCTSPLVEVDGVGCLFFSNTGVPYGGAAAECQFGSKPFSDNSLDVFEKLANYLENTKR